MGIAEHYEVINKELITVDNCVLKNFLDQIINGLENIYDELDSRFVVEKERFKLEMMNYRGFNEVGSSKEKFVSFVCRTFKLTLELYKLIRTHKLLYLAEMLEKTITFMYNEYVISKDYIAEFYYNLGCIELSLSNSRKATERLKVTFELIHSADYHKHLSYDKRVLDLIADNISWKSCFELVYEDVKQVLLEIGHEHECRDKLKACLEKVYQIVISQENLQKIEDLIEILRSIMDVCGETDNAAFYLYDIYEKLLGKQSYFKVMGCEVIGEGAQAKALLMRKLKIDDAGVARIISENTGIAEPTAFCYLNRSRIPAGDFHRFIEDTYGCSYSDLIVPTSEQIVDPLRSIALNVEEYFSDEGLVKVEYLHQRSIDLKYAYGEVFALIYIARLKFMFKAKDAFELMETAVSRAKKVGFELYTLAVTERAYILYISGKNNEALKKLELHRKRIKDQDVFDEYLGKFYYFLGHGYRITKDYSKAKKYMEMAYNYTSSITYKATRRNTIGLILRSQGKYAESIRNYKKVFALTSSKIVRSSAYNNIAYVYVTIKEYEKAIEYVEYAIALIDDVIFTNRKFNYYDTLFEIILLKMNGYDRFHQALNAIEKEFFSLHDVFENFNAIQQCVNRIVQIITLYGDIKSMKKLLGYLDDSIGYYENNELADKMRVIFANVIRSFIEAKMIKGVL